MNNTLGIATLALAAGLVATGPAATAGSSWSRPVDHRPCVSKVEANSLYSMTRHDLEQRWEVVGLGTPVSEPGLGRVVAYPRCGFPTLKRGFIGIHYVKRHDGREWAGWEVWHRQDPDPAPSTTAPTPPPGPPQLIPARGSGLR